MDTPNEGLIVIGGPGEFIDEMSLLNHDGLRTTSVRLHSDVQPLEMRRGEFDALLGRKPSIAYEMLRVLSARLG
jgi:CRP-like cAMP-binding protein